MLGMGFVGSWYYKDTQSRLMQLRENATRLELAAKTSEETIGRLQADAAQFEEANPGVTVEASYLGWDDFMATIKLKLADSNPPDLAHGNQGFTVDGTLIQNDLIIPLDK